MRSLRAYIGILAVLGITAVTAVPGIAQSGLPEGFIPPPLHPHDAELVTEEMGPGVYALVSTRPPVDNSGFIVGERGVLVVDAHINAAMAHKIQRAVRAVTDKPILYVVNTNFHGDHTFGNYAFPAATTIVAHRATAEKMRDFEAEKRFLLVTVENDPAVYGDVELRLPDVTFDDYLSLDLGDRVVELYHFGPGNTAGDTVVWEPRERVAWTGNLILGGGIIPFLLEGGPSAYRETIARFASTLEPRVVVPGHGPLTSPAPFDGYVRYLDKLASSIDSAANNGWTLSHALSSITLDPAYLPPAGAPISAAFIEGLHRFNIATSYPREGSR